MREEVSLLPELILRSYATLYVTGDVQELTPALSAEALAPTLDTTVLVAAVGELIVGTVALVESHGLEGGIRLPPGAACLRRLAVVPLERNQGIGRRLVAFALDLARERGFKAVVLQTDEDMVAARRLYESLGFVRCAELDFEVDDDLRSLGMRHALRTDGTPSPKVLFLPGTSARGSFWDPVVQRLPNIEAVQLDWPGLGGVPADPDVNSFDDLVEFVVSKIDRPCALVGQSMGGYVAARVALQRPDVVTHLVLAVTSAGVDRTVLGLPDWQVKWEPGDPGAPWVAQPQPHLDHVLPTIGAPTLLLWASNDEISPLPIAHHLNDLLSSSRLVVYPSDDHWAVRYFADDVARQIETHLSMPTPRP